MGIPLKSHDLPFCFSSQRSKQPMSQGPRSVTAQRLIDLGLQKAQLFRLAPGQISWVSHGFLGLHVQWGSGYIQH